MFWMKGKPNEKSYSLKYQYSLVKYYLFLKLIIIYVLNKIVLNKIKNFSKRLSVYIFKHHMGIKKIVWLHFLM